MQPKREKVKICSVLMISLAAGLFLLAACAEQSTGGEVERWRLPEGSLDRKQAFLGTAMARTVDEWYVPGGDPEQGRRAVQAHGCPACHVVPGVPRPHGLVGPPLTDWSDRRFIAGTLPNTPSNLIDWIQFPQTVEPGTAMPNLGVNEQDARDIAAFLYTLGR